MAHLLTLHPWFITSTSQITVWCLGPHSKIKTKTQEVQIQYFQIYSGFCSWQLSKIYKRITKEKKDLKGSYAINTCSAKLLSRQTESLHVLKSHWPLQKSIINKLYVLLNYLIISNNLISCQTYSKMQLRWQINLLGVNNTHHFYRRVASKYTVIKKLCFCAYKRHTRWIPMEIHYLMTFWCIHNILPM